ncbi:hypothetical protein B5F40_00835 [Gordonibacter sp. An230]|uniref:DUF3958 family protein n=1 Tax=Gordonibacter sp. An230 TaxID=1965592 RepID=UPI000B39202D|nr:DUF3958 family protein [Gordonibacter sp. An230]OUO92476.1 hypothetical protein B5F40_00835 [Gordonibacter sp. An230]
MEHLSPAYAAERERLDKRIAELQRKREDITALQKDIVDIGETLEWGLRRMRRAIDEVAERWPADPSLNARAIAGHDSVGLLSEQVNGILLEEPEEFARQLRALEQEENECHAERIALERRRQESENSTSNSQRNDMRW